MKKVSLILVVVIASFMVTTSFAEGPAAKKITASENTIESLLIGMSSDNLGLRTSAVYLLGEIQCNEAVIPLLSILKSDDNEEARIAAALSLYKLCDERGLYALKKASQFDESERVRKICDSFYKEHIRSEK